MNRPFLIASAAVFVAVILFLLLPHGAENGTVFADMRSRVREVKSVSYQIAVRWDATDAENEEPGRVDFPVNNPTSRVTVLSSGVWRREAPEYVSVTDPSQGKQLQLIPKSKEAHFMRIDIQGKEPDVLESIENARPDGGKLVETTLAGRKAYLFLVGGGDATFVTGTKIWVDRDSRLPLQIEIPFDGNTMTWSDFLFDEKLDMTRFELNVPEGYKLRDESSEEAAEAVE